MATFRNFLDLLAWALIPWLGVFVGLVGGTVVLFVGRLFLGLLSRCRRRFVRTWFLRLVFFLSVGCVASFLAYAFYLKPEWSTLIANVVGLWGVLWPWFELVGIVIRAPLVLGGLAAGVMVLWYQYWYREPIVSLMYRRHVKPKLDSLWAVRALVMRWACVAPAINPIGLLLRQERFIGSYHVRMLTVVALYVSVLTLPRQLLINYQTEDLILIRWLDGSLDVLLDWMGQLGPWAAGARDGFRGYSHLIAWLIVDWALVMQSLLVVGFVVGTLFPRDYFDSVRDALDWFVEREPVFESTAIVLQAGGRPLSCRVGRGSAIDVDAEALMRLHRQVAALNGRLGDIGQGAVGRATVRLEVPGAGPAIAHYRRLGSHGFVVAIPMAGRAARSHRDFIRFFKGVGRLVNVGESLKYE